MTQQPRPVAMTLTVSSNVNPGPYRACWHEGQVTPLHRLPVVAILGEHRIICASRRLPFAPQSVLSITAGALFEFIIDDQALLAEIARVLIPGGKLRLSVPNARGLGQLDTLNAFRYINDTIHRGQQPADLAEIGWRRHYHPHEIESMLMQQGFGDVQIDSHGTGLAELRLAGHLMRQHLRPSSPQLAAGQFSGALPPRSAAIAICRNLGAMLVVSARCIR